MGFNYFGTKNPCPVCDSSAPDCKCSVNGDGLHFCHTNRDGLIESPGYTYRGISANGQWGLWTEDGRDDTSRQRHVPRSSGGTFTAPPRERREESPFYRFHVHSEPLCPTARASLAASLGLPESAVDAFQECRYDGRSSLARPVYTIPEYGYDDTGKWGIVSIHVRDQDGGKKTYGDPDARVKRGLTCPPDWDRGGPIYVVEGASDTLALRAMGLTAIGRPGNNGGGRFLAALLRDHPGREVVIVAENDRKPNGSWPGREGAEAVAAEVARLWGHPVRVASLNAEVKDVRAWFIAHWNPGSNPLRLGEAFKQAVRAEVRVFRPDAPRPTTSPATTRNGDRTVANLDLNRMAALFAAVMAPTPENEAQSDEARARFEDALDRQRRADWHEQRCHHCTRQRVLCQRHKATHQPRTIWVRCEKWACDGCRTYLIAREVRNAAFRLGSADSLYEFGCTRLQYEAMTKRLRRAGAEYLAVRDGAGWWVCCSRRVEGSIPTTPEAALACFSARLDEWRGEKRPVKTSHAWRLPRAQEEDSSHENVLSLPVGTTHEEVAEVAARFGAYSRRQMRAAASRVQQVAEWVRDEPWSEEAANNFAISLMADLGGASERPRTPEEEAHADRPFEAVPW